MLNFLNTTGIFLVALGILVVLHEWGHYIMAKISGVWVEKFSIGFGPKLLGFKKNNTDYRIAPIPLGGYVKLYGQDPYEEADRDEEKAKAIAKDPRSFASKSYWQKMGIVLGGPAVNLLLCLILLPLAFMVGKTEMKIEHEPPIVIAVQEGSVAEKINLQKGDKILTFDGETVEDWQTLLFKSSSYPNKQVTMTVQRGDEILTKEFKIGTKVSQKTEIGFLGIEPHVFLLDIPLLGEIIKGSPAEKAELKYGDRIVEINDIAISKWTQMTKTLQEQSKASKAPLNIVVERDGQRLEKTVSPKFDESEKVWILGFRNHPQPELYEIRSYPFGEAVAKGFEENNKLYGKLFEFLGGLFSGQISANRLGGVIQIATEVSSAAGRGFGDFLYLLAFLSLQLGILNLMPIPVLDGGHAVFMTVEAVIRRSIPHKIRIASLYGGMFLVLSLMVYVTFNDLNKALGISEFWNSLVQNYF